MMAQNSSQACSKGFHAAWGDRENLRLLSMTVNPLTLTGWTFHHNACHQHLTKTKAQLTASPTSTHLNHDRFFFYKFS
jgi:hypothetical protein